MQQKILHTLRFQSAPGALTTTVRKSERAVLPSIFNAFVKVLQFAANPVKNPQSLENTAFYQDASENSDYRDVTTKKAVNQVLELAANQHFRNSEEILRRYNHVFRRISRFYKVVIMGLSCSDQDALYVQKIVNRARKIDFYCRGSTARKNFESYIAGLLM